MALLFLLYWANSECRVGEQGFSCITRTMGGGGKIERFEQKKTVELWEQDIRVLVVPVALDKNR